MYNTRNFTENVEYCEYVTRVCNDRGFELTPAEVQEIANNYAAILSDAGVYAYHENDDFIVQMIEEQQIKKEDEEVSTLITDYSQHPQDGEEYLKELNHQTLPLNGSLDIGDEGVYFDPTAGFQEVDQTDLDDNPPSLL